MCFSVRSVPKSTPELNRDICAGPSETIGVLILLVVLAKGFDILVALDMGFDVLEVLKLNPKKSTKLNHSKLILVYRIFFNEIGSACHPRNSRPNRTEPISPRVFHGTTRRVPLD